MSVSKKKYSKAKIHITEDNKTFFTVDGRVLDEKINKNDLKPHINGFFVCWICGYNWDVNFYNNFP